MVIVGNVVGGHYIGDLGLNVPYKGEARVQLERASWSKDLSFALTKGLVLKHGVVAGTPKTKAPIQIPSTQKKHHTSVSTKFQSIEHRHTPSHQNQSKVDSSEIDALVEQNALLMKQLSNMVENQNLLLKRFDDLLSNGGGISSSKGIHIQQASSLVQDTDDSSLDIDDVMFIPSTIRTSKTTEANLDVESQTSSKGSLDKASAALKNLNKSGGRSKRKKVSDVDE